MKQTVLITCMLLLSVNGMANANTVHLRFLNKTKTTGTIGLVIYSKGFIDGPEVAPNEAGEINYNNKGIFDEKIMPAFQVGNSIYNCTTFGKQGIFIDSSKREAYVSFVSFDGVRLTCDCTGDACTWSKDFNTTH